jgi:hypothetical protein
MRNMLQTSIPVALDVGDDIDIGKDFTLSPANARYGIAPSYRLHPAHEVVAVARTTGRRASVDATDPLAVAGAVIDLNGGSYFS